MRKKLKNHFVPHEGNDFKPHFVREKSVISFALVAVAIFGLAFSIKSVVTKYPDLLSAVITGVLVDLTNSNRLDVNLNSLTPNDTLAYAAQLKANDMAEKSYFAHTSPEGITPWHWFAEGGYRFIYAGENLAVNFIDSEDVVDAWMNSEGHRANILNGNFTEIGIAVASGVYKGRNTIYVVQLFGRPAIQQPLPTTPQSVVREDTSPESILASAEGVGQAQEASVSGSVAAAEAGQTPAGAGQEPTNDGNLEVLAEDAVNENEMFISAQNNDLIELEFVEATSGAEELEAVSQSNIIEKTVSSPKRLLEIIYIIMASIVFVSLILFLSYKQRGQHTKHVVYVVLLLLFLITLLYLSANRLFPQILII